MLSAWFIAVEVDAPTAREVAARLGAAGVRVESDGPYHGAGIVLAGGSDAAILGAVRELRASADVRLLVLMQRENASQELQLLLRAAGADDVVRWSTMPECLEAVVERLRRWQLVDGLLAAELQAATIVVRDAAFKQTLRDVVEVAACTSDAIVLLGQSGTGKEEVARLIHRADPRRRNADLVVVDCATVPPELAASEFFGHERGAFTGALTPRDGAFALAHRGTLFLDEVGELPPAMQAQLLRVVQEGTFHRVGGNDWHRTDFRLICATHREIDGHDGAFRRDFYHRIARWVFRLPPLAERPDDIVPLAEYFAGKFLGASPGFDRATMAHLRAREYPGNVRDLRNFVARLCGRHVGPGPIRCGDVAPQDLPAGAAGPADGLEAAARRALLAGFGLKQMGRSVRNSAIRAALDSAGGNVAVAAQLLQITDRALQMEIAKRDA